MTQREFAAFYERHSAALLSYLVRRAGDAEAGADLTAETFAEALAGLERFDVLHLVAGDAIVDTVPTYRGEGQNFG